MSACEKCWADAALRAMTLGGSTVEHYNALLDERGSRQCLGGDDSEWQARGLLHPHDADCRLRKGEAACTCGAEPNP